jgi:lipid A 3-O-deacylase
LTADFLFCASAVVEQGAAHTAGLRMAKLEPMNLRRVLMRAWPGVLSLSVQAMDLAPGGIFVEGAVADRSSYSATAGVLWPWSWRRESHNGELTGMTEAFISHWNARGASGRQSFTQFGVVPMFRYRGDHGRSDWFVEAGIGISVMDRLYVTPDKQFSTRWNFVDTAGVGRSFGPERRRELSLRLTHVSNGGIKKPNPGENFLQLRYAVRF